MNKLNRLELTGSSDLLTGHDHVRSKRDVEGSLEVDLVLGQETGNEASLWMSRSGCEAESTWTKWN
jgi:hypothetical protein